MRHGCEQINKSILQALTTLFLIANGRACFFYKAIRKRVIHQTNNCHAEAMLSVMGDRVAAELEPSKDDFSSAAKISWSIRNKWLGYKNLFHDCIHTHIIFMGN